MFLRLRSVYLSAASARAPLRLALTPSSHRGFHSASPLAKISQDTARSILGLSGGFTKVELKRAFVVKAKEVHPDVNPSPEATKQFADINEAFQVLEAELESGVAFKSEKVQTKDEKLEEDLEREFSAFRDWTEKRKRDKELDLKKRQQSIMWLLASAAAVLVIGQVLRGICEVYPFDAEIKKMWGSHYEELLADFKKENPNHGKR